MVTILACQKLIWRVHKVHGLSGETWDDVAELKPEHHQPTFHIYGTMQIYVKHMKV